MSWAAARVISYRNTSRLTQLIWCLVFPLAETVMVAYNGHVVENLWGVCWECWEGSRGSTVHSEHSPNSMMDRMHHSVPGDVVFSPP